MKKIKNMKTICLALVALALIVSLNIGNAWAYFTNNTAANGSKELNLDFSKGEIEEKITINDSNGKKTIWITNTGDYDCYVRMKAFSIAELAYTVEPEGVDSEGLEIVKGTWSAGENGFYYFSKELKPGESTEPIEVGFNFPNGETPEDFKVIIVEESTPVLYNEIGEPYADWDAREGDSTIVERQTNN